MKARVSNKAVEVSFLEEHVNGVVNYTSVDVDF